MLQTELFCIAHMRNHEGLLLTGYRHGADRAGTTTAVRTRATRGVTHERNAARALRIEHLKRTGRPLARRASVAVPPYNARVNGTATARADHQLHGLATKTRLPATHKLTKPSILQAHGSSLG